MIDRSTTARNGVPADAASPNRSRSGEAASAASRAGEAGPAGHGGPPDSHRRATAATELAAELDAATAEVGTDASRALRTLARLEPRIDADGGAELAARLRRVRTRALSALGRFDDALVAAADARERALAGGAVVEAARADLAAVQPLCVLGRFDDAIARAERARAALVEAGEDDLAARADINLGITLHRADRAAEAVRAFERARPLLGPDPVIRASLANSLGETLVALNEFDRADEAFREALEGFEGAGHELNAGIAEGNLADLALRRGRLDEALRRFERARRRLASPDLAVHRARLAAEEADATLLVGLPLPAAERFTQAIELLDRFGLTLEAARARKGLGRALLVLDRPAEASTALAAAADAFAALGNETLRARTDLTRAALALREGRESEAGRLARAAAGVVHDRPADAAAARVVLATIALRERRLDLAAAEVAAGLALAAELDLAPLMADLHVVRGDVARAARRTDEAVDAYESAARTVERVRGSLQAERWRAAFLGGREGMYGRLAATLLERGRRGDAARALEAVEQGRARTLVDRLFGARTEAGPAADEATHGLRRERDRARERLDVLYSRLGDALDEAERRRWAEAVEREERALERIASRLDAAGDDGAGAVGATEIVAPVRRALRRGDRLVVPMVLGEAVVVFVAAEGGVEAIPLAAPAAEVLAAADRLRFQVGRGLRPGALDGPTGARRTDDAIRAARALHACLLAPVESELAGAERLLVAPAGRLAGVPWAALHDGDGWLVERLAVQSAPAAGLFRPRPHRGSAHERGRPLVVGGHDADLAAVGREVAAVADALPGACVLSGADATRTAVAARIGAAPTVHVAAHGRFDPAAPASSGFRLADAWFTVPDLLEAGLVADLVVLSGCETARTSAGPGDEPQGLLRAVLAAGARRVVATLWPVADHVAADLGAGVHRALLDAAATAGDALDGAAVARTFASLQREHLARAPHPAGWAAFALVGEA